MSKNLLQDMIKIKRVNREAQMPFRDASLNPTRETRPSLEEILPMQAKKQHGNRPRYTLWFVAIVSFLFLLYSVSFLFLEAVVTVNPKMKEVVLNQNFSASLGGDADVLPFDLMVISGEENKTISTTLEKDVLEKAQGVVLIYNAFSSASQLLSVDTRLLGSNGKIYKTKKRITVPGMKDGVPGSVEVGIYGAEAGEAYNSGPLDFTIFGFKGTPKYSKFYARSKGEIAGGFKGKSFVISEAERLTVLNDLKTILQTKLFQKAMNQIPNGFILFKDAVFFSEEKDVPDSAPSKDGMFSIKLKGVLHGILFNENKLTKKIVEVSNINNLDSDAVYLLNIRDLVFSDLSDKGSASFENVKNIDFNLKGETKIVWKLDESKLIADLLGKSKKDFNQILLQYPNIDSAQLVISPFWRMSLPNKMKDIKMIVNYPK